MSTILNTDLEHVEKNYSYLHDHMTKTLERNKRILSYLEELIFNEEEMDISTKLKILSMINDFEKVDITAIKEFSGFQGRYYTIVSKIFYLTPPKDDEEMINVDEI